MKLLVVFLSMFIYTTTALALNIDGKKLKETTIPIDGIEYRIIHVLSRGGYWPRINIEITNKRDSVICVDFTKFNAVDADGKQINVVYPIEYHPLTGSLNSQINITPCVHMIQPGAHIEVYLPVNGSLSFKKDTPFVIYYGKNTKIAEIYD
ncbi:MAG: hypothetical protein U9P14_03245 [Gemmatimonadota bacterium]|nr:hypothetical protein [Gemmatimonadota bacterium]